LIGADFSYKVPFMERETTRRILFLALLGLVTLLFLYLLRPFFYAVFWAAVIAVVFHPLFAFFRRQNTPPNVAAALVMVVILFALFLPAALLGSLLLAESLDLYNSLDMDTATIDRHLRDLSRELSQYPLLAKVRIDTSFLMERLAELLKGLSGYIWQSLKGLTQNTIIFVAQLAIMFYTLFFFVRDGESFLRWVTKHRPLGGGREALLFSRFVVTARATLKVTLLIGGLQGFLGGVLFYLLGIKGALTWGVIMVGASILPGIGCSIVWAPAGLIMIIQGYIWQGILILVYGVLVISMVDNLLRPLLLGHDVQMHPLMIFLSTLGGIVLFGLTGFVLGPVIASLLLSCWRIYEEDIREKETAGGE